MPEQQVADQGLNKRLSLISDVASRLGRGGRFTDHVVFAAKEVCRVMDVDACVVRGLNGNILHLLGLHGVQREILSADLPANAGIAAELLQGGRPVTITNTPIDPITARIHRLSLRKPGHFTFQSYAGAPMFADGRIVGVLGVYMIEQPRAFDEGDLNLLQTLANTIGIAFANDLLFGRFAEATSETRLRVSHLLEDSARAADTIDPSAFSSWQQDRLRLEYDLRNSGKQITVHYQPLVHPFTGEVLGYEALARWQHPQRGLLQPADFIALAEVTGMISVIGVTVLQDAAHAAHHIDETVFFGVNVSVLQLSDPDFPDRASSILAEEGVEPSRFVLEITESAAMNSDSTAVESLAELARRGFRIFVDDFGAGYSSFSHLLRLPVSGIKIDRFFMPDSARDQRRLLMLGVISDMARELDVLTVLEGVELGYHREVARSIMPDMIQGFATGRPVPLAVSS